MPTKATVMVFVAAGTSRMNFPSKSVETPMPVLPVTVTVAPGSGEPSIPSTTTPVTFFVSCANVVVDTNRAVVSKKSSFFNIFVCFVVSFYAYFTIFTVGWFLPPKRTMYVPRPRSEASNVQLPEEGKSVALTRTPAALNTATELIPSP